MSAAPTIYEINAREEKCKLFCRYFQDQLVRVVENLTDDERKAFGVKAGVRNPPSEESKARVIEILKGKP